MKNESCRILADGHMVSNNTRLTGLNNNDIIIGPPGSGKTRSYVTPNVLQANESMIITDTKGLLHGQTAGLLRRRGFKVMELDLAEPSRSSWGFNPLAYVRYNPKTDSYNEQDILRVSAILCPVENSRDPFWDQHARMLLTALISYVLECTPRREHNLTSAVRLFREAGGSLDKLFGELCIIAPDSLAATQYKMFNFSKAADRMYASTLGILAEKLSVFATDSVARLANCPNQVRFKDLATRKTAVFVHISDTDRSMDRLATLFYAQALQSLCAFADSQPDGRLPVPVRFILDDFAAAADTCIPDFDKITSIIRSREISVSIILQSLSQLESCYGHSKSMTIINNADHLLYIGGQDVETARYISIKANKEIGTILNMPLDSAWLFTRGQKPAQVKKYILENHPLYPELCAEMMKDQTPQKRAKAERNNSGDSREPGLAAS